MKTIYRADDYYKNMGNIIGFFATKEKAEREIEFTTPVKVADGTFSQITEFQISEEAMQDIELSDTKRMLEEDIWGSGEIINDFYYTKP